MRLRERLYRWEWNLRASPEELWPLLSDTNRFNRDVGVGSIDSRAAGSGCRRVRLGRLLEWEEEPFEWERPRRFGVVRRFLRGPLRELHVVVELEPRGGGTHLSYEVRAMPQNALGAAAIPIQIGRVSARRFDRTIRHYDELARAPLTPSNIVLLGNGGTPRHAPGGKERLERAARALAEGGAPAAHVERLVETVARGDDLQLSRLRPYALAEEWGTSRREALELCLRATRAGLLELRWDLLCPLCRGAAESPSHLADLDRRVHCDSCEIDFDAELDRSVEVTFRPSLAIREVEAVEYCVGGPGVTPHVVAQQMLAPGEERALRLEVEPGSYRWRLHGRPGATPLRAQAGEPLEVLLRNGEEGQRLAVVERTAWSDLAATAAEVTALQVFRDLFASEVVRAGEPVSVGSLAVVFTDLRDSTRFYREIGTRPRSPRCATTSISCAAPSRRREARS